MVLSHRTIIAALSEDAPFLSYTKGRLSAKNETEVVQAKVRTDKGSTWRPPRGKGKCRETNPGHWQGFEEPLEMNHKAGSEHPGSQLCSDENFPHPKNKKWQEKSDGSEFWCSTILTGLWELLLFSQNDHSSVQFYTLLIQHFLCSLFLGSNFYTLRCTVINFPSLQFLMLIRMQLWRSAWLQHMTECVSETGIWLMDSQWFV